MPLCAGLRTHRRGRRPQRSFLLAASLRLPRAPPRRPHPSRATDFISMCTSCRSIPGCSNTSSLPSPNLRATGSGPGAAGRVAVPRQARAGEPSGRVPLYQGYTPIAAIRPVSLDLEPASRLPPARVEFLSPTELKPDHKISPQPEFPILFGRIPADRISTLRALDGPGPLAIDSRRMGERAAAVRMTSRDSTARRSAAQYANRREPLHRRVRRRRGI